MSENFVGVDIQESLMNTVQAMTTTQAVIDSSYCTSWKGDRAASSNIMTSSIDLRRHVDNVDTRFAGPPHFHLTIVSKRPSGRKSEDHKKLNLYSLYYIDGYYPFSVTLAIWLFTITLFFG